MGIFGHGSDPPPSGGGGGFYWSTSCRSDPRFNFSGYTYGLFGSEAAITKAILEKARELGIEPPDGIEFVGCK